LEEKVNLAQKLRSVDQYFSPRIVGGLNDFKLEIVKVKASSSGTSMMRPTMSFSCSMGG
jgi:hypothetical protein